jgi:bifunctional non-homologous end joining protein LigD
LPARSCVIDGEAVACDGDGLSIFEELRWRHHDGHVFMWSFDLLELDGRDMRPEPIEARKAALVRLLKKAKVGLQFNEHITVPGDGDIVLRHACALGLEASSRSSWGRVTFPAARAPGSSSRTHVIRR